jgi:V/A-type H+/Na+-transporting ATPase subunit E
MAEELQHLLDKIQNETISQAEQKAHEIISEAQKKADRIIKEAEEKAHTILQKADRESKAFTERSTKTLEQAGRDLLIKVGQGVENILSNLVFQSVDKEMTENVVKEMLIKMAEKYTSTAREQRRINILISPSDESSLVSFFADQYRKHLIQGVELKLDEHIEKGFKVSFVGEEAYHDFTREAIAEELSKMLRPHLSEIILKVAGEKNEPVIKE